MSNITITIQTDLNTDMHTLMAESYGFIAAAGPRLFRREPHPLIKFWHEDLNLARADAETLQTYINETCTVKKISKAKARKMAANL